MWHQVAFISLCLLTLVADSVLSVRLIRENGFKENTHFYHLGDGGHAYHFSSETMSAIYFKCALYERGCRGRAILRHNGGFEQTGVHNHPADPDFVGERHFRENLLNQIRDGGYVSYEQILDQARSDRRYTRRVRSRMTMNRLRGAVHRERMKKYPPIPQSLRELTQTLLDHPEVSKTTDGVENMYAGSITATDGSHHVAFISPRMLQHMNRVTVLQGDGTFKARPAVPTSSQCFVLVTTWKNCVIPLAWFLMESRTIPAYRAIFHLLKQLCPTLNPQMILSDWEYPQQAAWQEAFPNASIEGCLWHLGRAFVKKFRELGLLRYRKDFPSLMKLLRQCCAISLLPDEYFEDGLRVVMNAARQESLVIAFLLQPFFDYVRDKWLNNPYRRQWMSLFNCPYRTNNACETHNKMLRRKVGAYRPNVYIFIEAIATLENNASLDIDLLHAGGTAKRTRRWQSVASDRKIKNLSKDLHMNIFHNLDETILGFLDRASELTFGAFEDHVQQVVRGPRQPAANGRGQQGGNGGRGQAVPGRNGGRGQAVRGRRGRRN